MSCNCKTKVPNSVQIRQACVAYAAQATSLELGSPATRANFISLCKEIEKFIVGDKTIDDIDGTKDEQEHDHSKERGRTWRQMLLTQPASALRNLRELYVEAWENAGMRSVSDVIQCQFPTMPDGLRDKTSAALAPYGLSLRMSSSDIRKWLDEGPNSYGEETQTEHAPGSKA